ncbi:hypothetical protein PsasTeo6_19968 [Pseudomonas asiatica]|nr:hypothetical protein PsasTeo6_19968 [Pseudomonas asiatica]
MCTQKLFIAISIFYTLIKPARDFLLIGDELAVEFNLRKLYKSVCKSVNRPNISFPLYAQLMLSEYKACIQCMLSLSGKMLVRQ